MQTTKENRKKNVPDGRGREGVRKVRKRTRKERRNEGKRGERGEKKGWEVAKGGGEEK